MEADFAPKPKGIGSGSISGSIYCNVKPEPEMEDVPKKINWLDFFDWLDFEN